MNMNKIILKTIVIFFVLIVIFTVFSNNVLADAVSEEATGETKSIDSIIKDGDNFLNAGKGEPIDENSLINFSGSIYNLLLSIGTILAVIVGSILGIKFMTSTIDEKAKIKQMLVPYVVGCAVLFGAFGIWKIVINLLKTM